MQKIKRCQKCGLQVYTTKSGREFCRRYYEIDGINDFRDRPHCCNSKKEKSNSDKVSHQQGEL